MSTSLDKETLKNYALRRNRLNQGKANLESIENKGEASRRAKTLKKQEKEFSAEFPKEGDVIKSVNSQWAILGPQIQGYYKILYPGKVGPGMTKKKEKETEKDETD